MTCPWSDWDAGTVHFCEARLCAWVVEPSNAWSSVAYVLVGLWMMRGGVRDLRAAAVIVAQLVIGVGSFFFHGTGTFAGELVDQAGMFILSGLILTYAAAQARGWSEAATVQRYVALVVLSTLALLVVRPLGIPLFGVQLVAGVAWQLRLGRGADAATRAAFRPLHVGVGVFSCSFAIWLGDMTGVVCDPDNHLVTGHAVWHVLNAIAIERLGAFYAGRFATRA
jgi:hypothetical protein